METPLEKTSKEVTGVDEAELDTEKENEKEEQD